MYKKIFPIFLLVSIIAIAGCTVSGPGPGTVRLITSTPNQTLLQGCESMPDKLDLCELFSCGFQHPLPGEMMEKKILGLANGECVYTEEMPNSGRMDCKYSESMRTAVAQYYRDVASASSIGFNASSNLATGQTLITYTINGQEVENPLQTALETEACVISGYSTPTQTPTLTPTATLSCTDSDSGKDYYVKGYVVQSGSTYWDECFGDILNEKYCDATHTTALSSVATGCQYGCSNGACNAAPSPTPTPIINCGNNTQTQETLGNQPNFDCFIDASENCELAKLLNTATVDVTGMITTATTYMELKGIESNKCIYYQRTESVSIEFTDVLVQQMLGSGYTQEQINQQEQTANNNVQQSVGLQQTCKFNQVDLTAMLNRWKVGNSSTGDWSVAQCV